MVERGDSYETINDIVKLLESNPINAEAITAEAKKDNHSKNNHI